MIILLIIFKFIFILFSLFFLFWLFIRIFDSIFIKVPFVPIKKRAIAEILDLLKLTNDSVFYDIGSGDGRVLIAVFLKYPNSKLIGIEKGIYPYLFSLLKTTDKPIKILHTDYKKISLANATHIYCYLSEEENKNISQKIIAECEDGTRIVTCDFQIQSWTPLETVTLKNNGDKLAKTIFVYVK